MIAPEKAFEAILRDVELARETLKSAQMEWGDRVTMEGHLVRIETHAILQIVNLRREAFRLQPPVSEARN